MGVTGHKPFDNDEAGDWAHELMAAEHPGQFLRATLKAVTERKGDWLDDCESWRAIAAAEVIAVTRGHRRPGLEDSLSDWLSDEANLRPSASLARLAVRACERILKESELIQLWEDDRAWRDDVKRMIARLEREPKSRAKVARKSSTQSQKSSKTAKNSAIKTIRASGGFVITENRQPECAGTDTIADNKFFDAVAQMPSLQCISIGRTENQIPLRAFQGLNALTQLREIDLQDARISDAHLKPFEQFKGLKALNLKYTKIGDEGFSYLAECKKLTEIQADNCPVTDKGIQCLADLQSLKVLNLSGTQISDASFKAFSQLKSLEGLELRDTRLNGSGLKHLSALPKLRWLSLAGADIEDSHLKGFKSASLQGLGLDGTPITGSGFAALAHLPKLSSLSAAKTNVSDAACRILSKFPIEGLDLSETKVTVKGLEWLAKCPKLESLDLRNTIIGESGIAALRKSESLQFLTQVVRRKLHE